MRYRQLLWMLPALFIAASCTGGPGDGPFPRHGDQQRGQYSRDVPDACVDQDFIPDDIFGAGTQNEWMHTNAQDAEEPLCAAMEYFQAAVSFQASSQSTPTDRINSIRSSLHFLHQVIEKISVAFETSLGDARDPAGKYELYMANMLAEVTELAHRVASNGAEMSVGYSDAARATSGSYSELTEVMWGRYDYFQYWIPEYTDKREGRRGSALAVLQGWPWRHASEVTGYSGDSAILPVCSTNMEEHGYQGAVELLGKHGVPVRHFAPPLAIFAIWKTSYGNEFGSEYLTDKVNQERVALGLPALTYEEILEEHETTDEALYRASHQLYRELSIYLKPVVVQEYQGRVVGLMGMTHNLEEYQRLLVRSKTGAFYYGPAYGSPGSGTPSASAGLVTVLSNVFDLSSCLLAGDGTEGRVCKKLDQNDQITNVDAQEIVDRARSSIGGFVGSRSVRYDRLVYPSHPFLINKVQVHFEGFEEPHDAVVYSVPFNQGEIVPSFYKVLSCLRLGAYDGLDCEAYLSAAVACSAGASDCSVMLPTDEDRKMVIVAEGSKVIDMYVERRPDDVTSTSLIYTRHFVDQSTVSEYGKVITRRNSRDCSKPYSNSLGLPADMAIPLENELTSDSDTYEDAYAYYLTRAKEAGNEAANAVQRAKDDEIHLEATDIRVENQRQDAMDRIEQICGVGRTSCSTARVDPKLVDLGLLPEVSGSSLPCPTMPVISGLVPATVATQFNKVVAYVRCRAGKFVEEAGEMDISGLPEIVLQAALAGELTTLSFSQHGGEYKIALLDLTSALVDLRSAVASTNTVLETLPDLVEMERLNILAMQLETIALLLDAMSNAASVNPFAGGTAAVASATRALANVMQTAAEGIQFMITIQEQVSKIEQNMLSVEKAVLAIKSAIERLNGLELEQQQSLDRADRLGQAELAQYVGAGTPSQLKAFRQMTLVSHLKARRAIRRAKKMAFIARKAVEQRLAVDLTQEKEMPVIGEPPAKWVDDLFTMYSSTEFWEENSAAYTYVQRLEDYVYNYPFQYPFADGLDTAVISLRDDLSHFNQSCLVPGNLRNIVDFSEEIDRWDFVGGTGTIVTDAAEDPFGGQTAEWVRHICGFFHCPDLVSPEYVDNFGQSTSYMGSVHLRTDVLRVDASIRLVARYRCTDDWDTVISTVQGRSLPAPMSFSWRRFSVGLSRLRALDDSNCSTQDGEEVLTLQMEIGREPGGGEVYVSGAQIEQGESATKYEMAPTYGTHEDCLTVTVQDPWSTDPEDTIELTYYDPMLRRQKLLDSFSAKCADDQFAVPGQAPGDCAEKGGVDYMERQFTITLDGIESGSIVQQGQIGGGNYNYRINDLAINLVGSNVKDCSLDPGAGTTCYANQFIPYDLIQDGAVKIRNHAGVELPFKLSVGRIHQAKGLAAERLMTNPLSSTDSALIQQYRKNEFRGRPIQGVYTLRIHAVPSLRWTNIEDIQFVLGYRYWSAFSNP